MKNLSSKILSSPLLKVLFVILIALNVALIYLLFFGSKVTIDDRQSSYSLSYKVPKNTPDLFSTLMANSDDFSHVSKIKIVLSDQSIPDLHILTFTYPVPIKATFGKKPTKLAKDIVIRIAIDPKDTQKMTGKSLNDELMRSIVQLLYLRVNPNPVVEKRVDEINKITSKYSQNNPFNLVKK